MFKDLKLWEKKLEYIQEQLALIREFDTSWYDSQQWATYRELYTKYERKEQEYLRLIEYLKGEKE